MKKLTFILVFLSSLLFSQTISFNLKNLNEVKIEIDDQQNILSNEKAKNLIDNVRIKLVSVGIKESQKAKSTLQFKIVPIKIGVLNNYYWLSLRVIENQNLERGGKIINSEIISYQSNIFPSVVSFDSLILEFLTSWLNDNK